MITWPFNTKQRGFTIVELLVVIVVIGILSSIGVIAYNGAQQRARNAARTTELLAWVDHFDLYAATHDGAYPSMPNGGYCLGAGFPDVTGDNIGDCHDLYYVPNRHSENQTLSDELKKVGPLPSGIRNEIDGSVGPYAQYSTTTIEIASVFEGGSNDCPNGTQYLWDDGAGKLFCGVYRSKT